jgi:ribosome-binding protein aMBF1 (putative translation factor)
MQARREELGLSRAALADHISCHEDTIRKLEVGITRRGTTRLRARLAKTLDLKVYLLTRPAPELADEEARRLDAVREDAEARCDA